MRTASYNNILLFIAIFLLTQGASGEEHPNTSEMPDSVGKMQVIAAPYVSASSDEGLLIGVLSSFAKYPEMLVYLYGYWSTRGYIGSTLRGEKDIGRFRLIGRIHLSRILRHIYPESSDAPDEIGSAKVSKLEIKLALMRKLAPGFEIGPELTLESVRGDDLKDGFNNAVSVDSLLRFGKGSLLHLGGRSRYHTTSTLRPLDGIIIDGALSAGRSDGDAVEKPQFDYSVNIYGALAHPVTSNIRIYLRGQYGYQSKATPPVMMPLGGETTLRGQPDQRDFGRWIWNGRSQMHFTALKDWDRLLRNANHIWHLIPVLKMDIETIAFLDIGKVGDPEFGWKPTRLGYGAGLRIVFPPENVFRLDFARSPGGDLRFYIGVGETL